MLGINCMKDNNVLDFAKHDLFYYQLYTRLFDMLFLLMDENKFNINKIKFSVKDFLDIYSYYIIKKKEIQRDEVQLSDKSFLELLESFDKFTKNLDKFPSANFVKTSIELKLLDGDLSKLSKGKFFSFMGEYYDFFNEVNNVLKQFVDVSSISGFLPNVRSRKSTKTIGYQNTMLFFEKLEALKVKMTEITSEITYKNLFKSRRCVCTLLVIFSPYFGKDEAYNTLIDRLNFNFVKDETIMEDLRNSYGYKGDMPLNKVQHLEKTFLSDLRSNVSVIKRFVSYEFGEIGMSPKINKKYSFDPTGV